MRDLTAKQKKLIMKWFREHEPTEKEKLLFGSVNTLKDVNDLTDEQYKELVDINDTEILFQNVNNFISDLRFK